MNVEEDLPVFFSTSGLPPLTMGVSKGPPPALSARPRRRRKPSANKVRRAVATEDNDQMLGSLYPPFLPDTLHSTMPYSFPNSDGAVGDQTANLQLPYYHGPGPEAGPGMGDGSLGLPSMDPNLPMGPFHGPQSGLALPHLNLGDELLAARVSWIMQCGASHKRMVRMLMSELFTQKELRECSVTGKKGTRCDIKRRSLDPNKVNIIIDYIQRVHPEVAAADIRILMAQKLRDERISLSRSRRASLQGRGGGEAVGEDGGEPSLQDDTALDPSTAT